ncbi:hypothetical protein CVH10_18510, partial [Halomonas sp. ND22Bw]
MTTVALTAVLSLAPQAAKAERQAIRLETLDRSVVATPMADGGVFVQWRLSASDSAQARFEVFRDGVRLGRTTSTDT